MKLYKKDSDNLFSLDYDIKEFCRKTEMSSIGINSLKALIPFLLFGMTGCNGVNEGKVHGRHAVTALMDSAELIMNDNPERAYKLIDSIDSRSISSRALRARYALLYSEAQYKNYIDESSDSLIMIAVSFYSVGNDYLSRFRSYYSLGCIYNGTGRYTDAAVALSEAERLADYVDDDFRLGLLYSQLGDVYYKSYDYSRAEQYYRDAEDCYRSSNKDSHREYALYDIASCLMGLHFFNDADSVLMEIQKWSIDNDSQLYAKSLISRFSCSLFSNEVDSSTAIINKYLSDFGEPDDDWLLFGLLAHYYNKLKDFKKSNSYLQKAWNSHLMESDTIILLYFNSLLAENEDHLYDAYSYYRQYISRQNDRLRFILREPVLGAQKEHFQTLAALESLKNKHNRTLFVFCITILVLIMTIVYIIFHYQKKRMEEQLYESLTVVEELTAANNIHSNKITQLKSEVIRQFHERHDVSNRLYSMYFDTKSEERITKQQLIVIINGLVKDYTSPENIRSLDKLLNESYNGIIDRLSKPEIGLADKELQLLRFSLAGLSLKSVSVIMKETPQNIYQIKSRLMKRIRSLSYEMWNELCNML